MSLLDSLGGEWSFRPRRPPVVVLPVRCFMCGEFFRNFPLWLAHSRAHWSADVTRRRRDLLS